MQEQKQKISDFNRIGAAESSLADALRASFAILKWIMFLLIIVFFASGFSAVEPDERALVLRFGKIRGVGENRVLKPGLHWIFPYPIEEMVKIPVEKTVNLPINDFWYFQTEAEKISQLPKGSVYIRPQLDPIVDGYCLTRSEQYSVSVGSDYNIVHSKWQLTYQIDDPERFFENIYVEMKNLPSGINYADVITENLTPLLEKMVADAIVTAMVNYTIDEALSSQDRIPRYVEKLLQEKLDTIESGIKVVSIQLTAVIWPRQVAAAFAAFISVSQESQKIVTQARGYAENTLNETAGPVATELLDILNKDDPDSSAKARILWPQLAGTAQEEIAQARAYRTKVVETAKANAEYLKQLLPEYKKRPKLVLQKIYQDAIEYVLNNADEKMIIQPAEGAKGKEFRLILSRDPSIKPKEPEK